MQRLLNEKQQNVYDNILNSSTINEICLYGSGRSGKTFLTAYFVFMRAILFPGSFHLFLRATMTALTSGVVSQTFPNLFNRFEQVTGINMFTHNKEGFPTVRHLSTPHNKFIFSNGSEIRFVGLDTQTTNKAATDKILSQEYLTAVFEEGTEIDFEVIEKVKTRLAQKIIHPVSGVQVLPKWVVTLNPRTFDDWDYVYFQEHESPINKEPLLHPEKTAVVHFSINDNLQNVSEDYVKTLESLSTSQRQRFLLGMHGDNFEGELFKKLHWEQLPPINEFEKIVIYTDPSYKSGAKNDYKATMVVGKRIGAFWVINGIALQCTTDQMILNVFNMHEYLKHKGFKKPIPIWFENAGMPDDFVRAINDFSKNSTIGTLDHFGFLL